MTKNVLLIHGPNFNLLGVREPETYGNETLAEIVARAEKRAASHDLSLSNMQSNHEGAIIDAIHDARETASGIIINAGAFTHYSWAIHDALLMFDGPIIEVHISNTKARDHFRHKSVISPVAVGVIQGLGSHGYELAVDAMAKLLGALKDG